MPAKTPIPARGIYAFVILELSYMINHTSPICYYALQKIQTTMTAPRRDGAGTDADCHATDPKLPEDWICHNLTDVCLSTHDHRAAYCCPQSTNCDLLAPVPKLRNIGLDSVLQAIIAPIEGRFFMKDPQESVRRCGNDGCCPMGYSCLWSIPVLFDPQLEDHKSICTIGGPTAITPNRDSSLNATFTEIAPPTTSTELAAPTGVVNTTRPGHNDTAAGNNSTQPHGGGSSGDAAIIAGATIGVAVGIIAVVLIVVVWLRYSRKQAQKEEEEAKSDESRDSQEQIYWSYDGRRDADGNHVRRWSDSTLAVSSLNRND
jgi:hypothetical protein